MFLNVAMPADYDAKPCDILAGEVLSNEQGTTIGQFQQGSLGWQEMVEVFRRSYVVVYLAGTIYGAEDLASCLVVHHGGRLPPSTRSFIGHVPVEQRAGKVMVAFTSNCVPRDQITAEAFCQAVIPGGVPEDQLQAVAESFAACHVCICPVFRLPEEIRKEYGLKMGRDFVTFFGI